jgi:hypothetical protein
MAHWRLLLLRPHPGPPGQQQLGEVHRGGPEGEEVRAAFLYYASDIFWRATSITPWRSTGSTKANELMTEALGGDLIGMFVPRGEETATMCMLARTVRS